MNIRLVSGALPPRRGWARHAAMVLVSFSLLALGLLDAPATARADNWGLAWEIGAITATPKGNPFVFRLSVDKSYSEEFSIGPSFYLSPFGDNSMYSGSLNAQFHVGYRNFHISPFFGIGAAHRRTEHDDDTALLVPMGISGDMPIGEKLYLVATFGINLHSGLELEGEQDDASIGLTAGISYRP